MDSTARRLLFPFSAPPAARLHALVAARRLKAVASAHAACSATAAGAVAAGTTATDSVIPLPSAASPPAAHHCQLSIVAQRQRIIAAALHSCFATMQPALCRLRRPSLTACSRFDSSASWVSQIVTRLCRYQNLSSASGLAIGVAAPPTVSCQSHCCVRIASSSTTSATKYLRLYSSQHSLLARGSIPRQVESNTKVTALCTARMTGRISICAVCALATGPLRRLGECKAHSTAPLSSLVSASHAMPCTSR